MPRFTKDQWMHKYVRETQRAGVAGCTVSALLNAKPEASRRLQREAVAELDRLATLFRIGPPESTRGSRCVHRSVIETFCGRLRAQVEDHPSGTPADTEPPDESAVLAAYRALVEEGGFRDVSLGDLAAAIPCSSEALRVLVVEMRNKGLASLSKGDWSLASEAERSAGVEIDGRIYVRVRLRE